MRKTKKRMLLSFPKPAGSTSIPQTTPPAPDLSPSILFRNISELPLYLFIDAVVDDRIHALVISGHPTEKELSEAWTDILLQYNEAMADNEAKLFFSLHKQILQREIDLKMIDLALIALKDEYIPRLVDFLNRLFSSTLVMDWEDKYDYEHKLQVFRNLKASVIMARDMKRIQYEAIEEKRSNASQKPDRNYFQTYLLNLSDFVKYEIDEQISVFTFCERVKRYNKYLDSVKTGK